MSNKILKNWELKILALVSAIVLWFFVVGIENNSYQFPEQIDIHAVNVPPDMTVTNDLGKATIRIQADQSMIKNLTADDFDISVDLQNAKEAAECALKRDVPGIGSGLGAGIPDYPWWLETRPRATAPRMSRSRRRRLR